MLQSKKVVGSIAKVGYNDNGEHSDEGVRQKGGPHCRLCIGWGYRGLMVILCLRLLWLLDSLLVLFIPSVPEFTCHLDVDSVAD